MYVPKDDLTVRGGRTDDRTGGRSSLRPSLYLIPVRIDKRLSLGVSGSGYSFFDERSEECGTDDTRDPFRTSVFRGNRDVLGAIRVLGNPRHERVP